MENRWRRIFLWSLGERRWPRRNTPASLFVLRSWTEVSLSSVVKGKNNWLVKDEWNIISDNSERRNTWSSPSPSVCSSITPLPSEWLSGGVTSTVGGLCWGTCWPSVLLGELQMGKREICYKLPQSQRVLLSCSPLKCGAGVHVSPADNNVANPISA